MTHPTRASGSPVTIEEIKELWPRLKDVEESAVENGRKKVNSCKNVIHIILGRQPRCKVGFKVDPGPPITIHSYQNGQSNGTYLNLRTGFNQISSLSYDQKLAPQLVPVRGAGRDQLIWSEYPRDLMRERVRSSSRPLERRFPPLINEWEGGVAGWGPEDDVTMDALSLTKGSWALMAQRTPSSLMLASNLVKKARSMSIHPDVLGTDMLLKLIRADYGYQFFQGRYDPDLSPVAILNSFHELEKEVAKPGRLSYLPEVALGVYSMQRRHNFGEADRHFDQAIQLDPFQSAAYQWKSESLSAQRRHPEAIDAIIRAERCRDSTGHALLRAKRGLALYYSGRLDDADRLLSEAVADGLAISKTRVVWARVLVARAKRNPIELHGLFRDAHDLLERLWDTGEQDFFLLCERATICAAAKDVSRDFAGRCVELTSEIEQRSEASALPYPMAQLYSEKGDYARAIGHLEEAVRSGCSRAFVLNVDPRLDGLRRHRERDFQAISKEFCG